MGCCHSTQGSQCCCTSDDRKLWSKKKKREMLKRRIESLDEMKQDLQEALKEISDQ
jgi:hypothetical protein